MKVLRVIESFYPYMSGPANQAFAISRELEKRGISSPIHTTNFRATTSPTIEKINCVNIVRHSNNFCIMAYCVSLGFKKSISQLKCDLYHAHNYRSYETDVAYKVARQKNRPFVINTHGSLLGYDAFVRGIRKMPYKMYDFFSRKKCVLGADAVIVSSKQEYGEALTFGVPEDILYRIPMGINVDDYSLSRARRNDSLKLLFVGRISRDRKVDLILKALAKIDNATLTIVGEEAKRSALTKSGYMQELRRMVRELKLKDRVIFTGPKYGKDLIQYYQDADIFIYPSIWENFGQAILEAAASGLPIISTPVGVADEIIGENKGGHFVSFNDVDSIIERVSQLRDFKVRKQIEEKNIAFVRDNFSWESVIDKYMKVYEKLQVVK